jgi:polysaccharide export outer membrane protein
MTRIPVGATCLLLLMVNAAHGQSAGDYVIGIQDVLAIKVFDEPELAGRYAVELDGSIAFPLVGRVTAAGTSVRGLEAALTKQLSDGYYKNPQVTVAIDQYRSRRVFVTGEVRNPGTYAMTGDLTLIEVLAKSGSTAPTASDEVVVVRRGETPDEADIFRVNLEALQYGEVPEQNITLRDGDLIYVARAEQVFVFGEVKSPGAYAIKSSTTVLQALTLAGGVLPSGAMNRVKVVRLIEGEKRDVRVEPTEVVRPGDTLVVPERFF